jgi:uncharacterized protein YdeI (YjbR/CyaY-like superfamily)
VTPADDGLPVLAFADAAEWEAWLAGHSDAAGLWLKLAKKGNAASTLTRGEAIDGALVYGWIDGQAASFDGDWSLIRLTPRRARSRWSEKNRDRATELLAAGRITPRGLAEVERARADGRWDAAYPPASTATVPDDLAAALDAVPAARAFFDALTGANRYAVLLRIHEAKRPVTRAARIERFVAMCAAGETIHDPPRTPGTVTAS